jgi:hypothetical protein
MKLHNELPVYKATYDMLLEIFQLCRGFSREYKFTVGESLKKETIDLLTLIFRANSSEKKTYKSTIWRAKVPAKTTFESSKSVNSLNQRSSILRVSEAL